MERGRTVVQKLAVAVSPAPVVEDANQLFMTLVVVAALLSVATAWSA